MPHIHTIAVELDLKPDQVRQTADLLSGGATVPFIARYRKEATGSLDDVAITAIRDRLEQLEQLDKRRAAILKSLKEHGHLSPELEARVRAAATLTQLEDIYLPYRPKRRTRATIAREKGLEPLADLIHAQKGVDPIAAAAPFVDAENGVDSVDAALAGARDIIAERVNEDPSVREPLRAFYNERSAIRSKVIPGQEEVGAKFRDYFDWQEPLPKAVSHRILALRRGEKEGVLSFRIEPPEAEALALLESRVIDGVGPDRDQVREAAHDSYRRLLGPSLETEMRLLTKAAADDEAIRVFSENLRELLLAAPLGQRRVMAIDPGFRTGCKLVCLDRQGKLLFTDTVFPGQGEAKTAEAKRKLVDFFTRFEIDAVAVGNGTGGRELEAVVRSVFPAETDVIMVNESGASVYSASPVAREEFPDHDVTVRGAVSIGRRLMDPLAELVKIDPKSIGVGQYQHDVDQPALKKKLDDVVASCVNAVGVEVNTASKQLLTYVSGLGPQLARSIVHYRDENGPFTSRAQLKKVPRMGPKAFEQCAGFLRIRDAENVLDRSAVHPESYHLVDRIAASMSCGVQDLMRDHGRLDALDLRQFVSDQVGLPTLTDIRDELKKPGRDPRPQFEAFHYAEDVNKIDDLEPGMKLPGIITNVTNFGAFVDIGVHQDGLVHVSQLADRYVRDPNDVVKVQQKVTVTVMEIDLPRQRISLSMRQDPEQPSRPAKQPEKREPAARQEGARANKEKRTKPGSSAGGSLSDALRKAGLS